MDNSEVINYHTLEIAIRTTVYLETHIKESIRNDRVNKSFIYFVKDKFNIVNEYEGKADVYKDHKHPNKYDIIFEFVNRRTNRKITISLLHIYACVNSKGGVIWYDKELMKEYISYHALH